MNVLVVRTGTANLASVLAGLTRAGGRPTLTDDPDAVRRADRVMLPGVGAFAAALVELRARGLDNALRERQFAMTHQPCVQALEGGATFGVGQGDLPSAAAELHRMDQALMEHE